MRFSLCVALVLTGAVSLEAQTIAHAPRGNASTPEALAWSRYALQSKLALASLGEVSAAPSLPPPPAGVTDLTFAEFFGPIGDRGLDYSEKIRALAGKRVRLAGCMVREQERAAGLFRFAGWPVVVETQGLCAVDDTPPSVAYVVLPSMAGRLAPWRPGRLVLIGTLEFGPRAEPDGRNSFIRLILDDPESVALFGPVSTPLKATAATP
jgi:hypothetical protein